MDQLERGKLEMMIAETLFAGYSKRPSDINGIGLDRGLCLMAAKEITEKIEGSYRIEPHPYQKEGPTFADSLHKLADGLAGVSESLRQRLGLPPLGGVTGEERV